MPDVTLQLGGQAYGGWTSVEVSTSLGQVAGTFRLELSDRWPGQPQHHQINPGAACVLRLGDQVVITGYVDEVSPSYSDNAHTISVSGRDKTCDLVDCCHDGKTVQWTNASLLTIAKELCDPFGIAVASEVDLGKTLPSVTYGQGDKIHEFLAKQSKLLEVLPISYGDGRLVFTRAGSARAAGSLVLGRNIKSGRGQFSNADRYQTYQVKSSASQLDFSPPKPGEEGYEALLDLATTTATPAGLARDGGVTRHRPLVIVAEGAGDAQTAERRAAWEAASRAGKSRRASYTVQGWGPAAGSLWRINTLVGIEDAYLGLVGDYLIETATYRLSESDGTVCELAVVHPDAYKAQPDTSAAASIKSLFG